jgi:hypothetical protein
MMLSRFPLRDCLHRATCYAAYDYFNRRMSICFMQDGLLVPVAARLNHLHTCGLQDESSAAVILACILNLRLVFGSAQHL